MSIVTRRGDDGTTSLLYGQRVPKHHPQIEAVGAFDELNVALGSVRLLVAGNGPDPALTGLVVAVQKNLVALMGEVACAESDLARFRSSTFDRIGSSDIGRLDAEIGRIEKNGVNTNGWAAPGANALAIALDSARTVARRAERRLVALSAQGRNPRPELLQFANRLSDLLWLLAREAEG